MSFLSLLLKNVHLPEACTAALQESIQVHIFPKNQLLLWPGQISEQLYYVESGLAREYVDGDTGHTTCWLAEKGDLLVALDSYLEQKPTQSYLQVLRDSTLQSIAYRDLKQLVLEFPILEKAISNVQSHYLEAYLFQLNLLRMGNFPKRYEEFVKQYPRLSNEVQANYLASYLGMSSFHIYHIRSNIAKGGDGNKDAKN
ncbi:MAG: Crp/Fnr family transcriptional regulator [Runella sp.]